MKLIQSLIVLFAILVPLYAFAQTSIPSEPDSPPPSMYATQLRVDLHGPGFDEDQDRGDGHDEGLVDVLIPVATVLAFVAGFVIWLWRRWRAQTRSMDESRSDGGSISW